MHMVCEAGLGRIIGWVGRAGAEIEAAKMEEPCKQECLGYARLTTELAKPRLIALVLRCWMREAAPS